MSISKSDCLSNDWWLLFMLKDFSAPFEDVLLLFVISIRIDMILSRSSLVLLLNWFISLEISSILKVSLNCRVFTSMSSSWMWSSMRLISSKICRLFLIFMSLIMLLISFFNKYFASWIRFFSYLFSTRKVHDRSLWLCNRHSAYSFAISNFCDYCSLISSLWNS